MAKKKKPKKKPVEKPLLSDVGILHLENSFVPPTQESGLLMTVGGLNMEGQALVLAPNYGYGISASAVAKVLENQQKMVDPTPPNVVEVNGMKVTTIDKNLIELNQDFPMNQKPDPNSNTNPETLSIAELVRHIGGAKDKPFMRSDVMEDLVEDGDKEKEDEGKENHVEDVEFYESIGVKKHTKKPVKVHQEKPNEATTEEAMQNGNEQQPADAATTSKRRFNVDNTKSIADYYKTYCHYYFGGESDPYSDTPLAFGKPIAASGEQNKDEEPDQSIIELAKMAQRARKAMEAAQMAAKVVYGPQPQQEVYFDPLPMEVVKSSSDEFMKNASASMVEYWEHVKENPRDFNRWTYLVQHAEDTKNLVECRKAYSAFLPLFPYCFGYWKRYADIEKGRMYHQRALLVLLQGLEFNPLSIDLWQSYLALFQEANGRQEGFQEKMREQYEKAIATAGIEFRSDALWEDYMNWELNNKKLKNVFQLYRRIMMCPTRLYNRHWDNFKILVRDHHPRDFMEKTEYEILRKKGCKILGYRYLEEPEYEPGEIVKTSKPEDKLMNHVKDKIVMKLEKSYKKLAGEADKRWDFEDKIKRPYFHVKPLDNGQLRNWEEYLNFEIAEGNNDRIVLLFERCLIACALYERFWCKYARYLEKYYRQEAHKNESVSQYFQKSSILKSFEIATRKDIIEEEELVATVTDVLKGVIDKVILQEQQEREAVDECVANLVTSVCNAEEQEKAQQDLDYLKFLSAINGESVPEVTGNVSDQKPDDSVGLGGHSASAITQEEAELPHNSVERESNDKDVSSLTSVLSVPVFSKARYVWQEIIRDVYKRACVVHCPRKPVLRLQWAAFEEEIGNISGARQLINQVLERFPNMLDAKSQLIELERRAGRPDEVVNLYEAYLKEKRPASEHTTLSFKYAKFLFKEQCKPEQALAVLRKALRKDKGNHLIYNYVFEICYFRYPSDRKGASAALELAIQCKEISKKHKLDFLRRKVLFLQEHGELTKYRDALDQLYSLRDEVAKDQAALDAAKIQAQYATIAAYSSAYQQRSGGGVPINFEPVDGSSVPDKAEDTLSKYKKVAPSGELLDLSSYGYSSTHPDMKMQENQSQNEYDKLLTSGYRNELQDKTYTRSKEAQVIHKRRRFPLYIVPPREEDQPGNYRKRPRRDIRIDLMNKS